MLYANVRQIVKVYYEKKTRQLNFPERPESEVLIGLQKV